MTKSVLDAEIIALSDMFDVSFTICTDTESRTGLEIQLKLLKDRKCVLGII